MYRVPGWFLVAYEDRGLLLTKIAAGLAMREGVGHFDSGRFLIGLFLSRLYLFLGRLHLGERRLELIHGERSDQAACDSRWCAPGAIGLDLCWHDGLLASESVG
jgi:hypothetical protein